MKINDICEGQVVQFTKKKSDTDKYSAAVEKQNTPKFRKGAGTTACKHCHSKDCDFDCEASQDNDAKELAESTTAGCIASVSVPMNGGKTAKRAEVGKGIYGNTKTGSLMKGKQTSKKFANSINESKELGVNNLAMLIRALIEASKKNKNTKKIANLISKYYGWMRDSSGKKLSNSINVNNWLDESPFNIALKLISQQDPKLLKKHGVSLYKMAAESKVIEGDLKEDDLIVGPGSNPRRTGLIKQGEKYKSILSLIHHAADNASDIYEIMAKMEGDHRIETWVKDSLTLVNAQLDRVHAHLKKKQPSEGMLGAAAGGAIGGAVTKSAAGVSTGAKIGSAIQNKFNENKKK